MKVLSLISTVLLALSLTGAVQAKPDAPPAANVAPATIVLAHCEANDPTPCGINGVAAVKTSESDVATMPAANSKQQPQNDEATPVPEPQTFIMLMLGLVVLGFASRRRSTEKFSD